MNAVRPIAVKLDQDTRDRLKRLAYANDRKSTRLNSSHLVSPYPIFGLQKKQAHT